MNILDKIISAESSGNVKKANEPNKTASALGLGQFINATRLDVIRRYRHDLADGKSDAEILELRKNPDLSKEMTARYAAENETRLGQAGVPVTPASTYLMHFAGPGGGVRLMKADPNAPVESILNDDAIQANPFLRGKTAGCRRSLRQVEFSRRRIWSGEFRRERWRQRCVAARAVSARGAACG